MSNRIKTVILDSSVWVSYLLRDDSNHKQAVNIVEKYDNDKHLVLVPEIVFYEVITVLIRNKKQNLIEKFIELNFRMMFLNSKDFLDYILEYKDYLTIKTQDTLIIIHCLLYNVDHFETFDIQQRNTYNIIKSS